MTAKWILLVDDDLEDQEMLIEAIQELDDNIPITTASDGREALDQLTARADEDLPSLLVLDYKMPYMHAAEVLEALLLDKRYATMPKVVWSSSYRDEDVKRCLKAGACDYFQKPATGVELRSIARRLLQCRQSANCKQVIGNPRPDQHRTAQPSAGEIKE